MAHTPDVADFEVSKENILPIQQGRKAEVLKFALAEKPEDKLLQQRREYEKELRSYSGDDPLSIWCEYIKWVEQNYPKGGREGNIGKLIQQCLLILKDEKKYHNDDRFIDVWIKFANLSMKPMEVYSSMFSRGIGCQSARFYVAWAWEAEQLGNIKQADEILTEGIKRNAQPLESLKFCHSELEMRLAQTFAKSSQEEVYFESDQRSAFSVLKAQPKNKAPISRIGDATLPSNNQKMTVKQQKPLKNSQGKIPFKIYTGDNETTTLPAQTKKSNFFSHSEAVKENERKPSKWSKVKLNQVTTHQSKAPEFTVHCDNTPQPESAKKLPQSTKVLTSRQDTWAPAVALFEPPNPMVRPMYNKTKIYGGGEEFSFEELMAIKWFEKQKEVERERKRKLEELEKEELKNQLKQLQEKVEFLTTVAAPVLQQKNVPSVDVQSPTENNKLEENVSHSIPIIKTHKEVPSDKRDISKTGSEKVYSSCITQANLAEDQHDEKNSSVLQKLNSPFAEKSQFGTVSMANEVDCMLRELYNGTFKTNTGLDDMTFNAFNLKKGDSILDGKKDQLAVDFVLDNESDNKTGDEKPFYIYRDPTEVISVKSNFPIYQDINDENTPAQNFSKNENVESVLKNEKLLENEENVPPSDYFQETEKRELAGILQESKNIYFVPLEKQLEMRDLEDEEMDDGLDGIRPLDDNVTLLPEQFAAGACFVSTPCVKPQLSKIRETTENTESATKNDKSKSLEIVPENILIQQLLNDALNLADSEKVLEILTQVSFDIGKRQNVNYFHLLDHLKLCHEITKNQKLRSIIKQCISRFESDVEKTKDFNQTNLALHSHTLQLSTIMEASRESKSSSSSNSLLSIKQKSITNSILSVSKVAKTSIFDSKSKENNISEKINVEESSMIDWSNINPFDPALTTSLLKSLKPPIEERDNFYENRHTFFHIKSGISVRLGNAECFINDLLTENAHSKIYSAQSMSSSSFINFDQTLIPASKLSIKVTENVNEWEFYICSELQNRLADMKITPSLKNSVMEIKSAVAFQNCLALVSDFYECGTLMDVANTFKVQNPSSFEFLIMFFTLEMLHIMTKVHSANILHGNIKLDNFILNEVPNAIDISFKLKSPYCLQLVNFNQAIDLKLLKPGITFSVKVPNLQFSRFKEQPWVYENDWYGILNCIHILLFSEQMQLLQNDDGHWMPVQNFKHFSQKDIWLPLFQTILNKSSCYEAPELNSFIVLIKERLQKQMKSLKKQILQLKLSYSQRP